MEVVGEVSDTLPMPSKSSSPLSSNDCEEEDGEEEEAPPTAAVAAVAVTPLTGAGVCVGALGGSLLPVSSREVVVAIKHPVVRYHQNISLI